MAKTPHEYDKEDEICDVSFGGPHLVILGAGASIAACPSGDANGKRLPSMLNLIETVGLQPILAAAGLPISGNFEDIFSAIACDPQQTMVRRLLEDQVNAYFSSLELPPSPTIYDYLVLSLRPKDIIATFNWDPFLVQALQRNRGRAPSPRTLFLHGNVAIGHCLRDKKAYFSHCICQICGEHTQPTKLLYPITEKNYSEDEFINAQWGQLKKGLADAHMLTIFGYGAPKSDSEAIEVMSSAWRSDGGEGSVPRELEQTEIINILEEEELVKTWSPFIYSHHYRTYQDFHQSWLARHPRRSCEAAWQQWMEAKFIDENPIPTELTLDQLWLWISTLTQHEMK